MSTHTGGAVDKETTLQLHIAALKEYPMCQSPRLTEQTKYTLASVRGPNAPSINKPTVGYIWDTGCILLTLASLRSALSLHALRIMLLSSQEPIFLLNACNTTVTI